MSRAREILQQSLVWVFDHPLFVWIFLGIGTIIFGFGLPNLKVYFNLEQLYPIGDPMVQQYRDFEKEFGSNDNLIFVVFHSDSIFTRGMIHRIRVTTDSLQNIPGVESVYSLTNTSDIRGSEGELLIKSPFEGIDPHNLDSLNLQQQLIHNPIFKNTLISADGKHGAFVIDLTEKGTTETSREETFERIHRIEKKLGWHFYIGGTPLIRTEYVALILRDLSRFLPLVIILQGIFLLITFRQWQMVIFPFITVGLALVWVLGAMGYAGFTLNVITYLTPILIMVFGVAYSIYFLVKFRENYQRGDAVHDALRTAIRKIGLAAFLTSVTTAVGFLSLSVTNIIIMRHFGYAVGFGAIVSFLITLLLLPQLLDRFTPKQDTTISAIHRQIRHRWIEKTIQIVENRQIPIILLTLILIGIAIFGTTKVSTESFLLDDVRPGNPVYDDQHYIERTMGDILPLDVIVRTKVADGVKSPEVLKQIATLENFIAQQPEIGHAISIVDYLRLLNAAMTPEQGPTLPKTRNAVAQYLLLYSFETENNQISKYVNYDYSAARIAARVEDVGSIKMDTLRQRIQKFVQKEISPDLDIELTGGTLLALQRNKYMVRNLLSSFLLAFGIIFLIMVLLFRSWKIGIISIIPNVLPMLVCAGFMGWAGIRLIPSTAMTFAIAIGIAVDDTIHFLARFRQEYLECYDHKKACQITLRSTGTAMISTTIVLFIGFATLLTSNFAASSNFGIVSLVTLATALLGDLYLLPVLLMRFHPKLKDQ